MTTPAPAIPIRSVPPVLEPFELDDEELVEALVELLEV